PCARRAACAGERPAPAEPPLAVALPAAAGNRLDRLHGDAATWAERAQLLELGGIVGRPHHREVVRQQHRVEGEALEAAAVHLGHPRAMTGDADEPDQTRRARFHQGFERTARTERDLPFALVDEVVELNQIDLVDAQPLARALEACARALGYPLTPLCRQVAPVAIALHPPSP